MNLVTDAADVLEIQDRQNYAAQQRLGIGPSVCNYRAHAEWLVAL